MVQAQVLSRRNRHASPARWQRALRRALFAGVEAKQVAGSGEWIVSSASAAVSLNCTDGISCGLRGGHARWRSVCLHRAAYWYAVGVLERDPEPEPPSHGRLPGVLRRWCAVVSGGVRAPLSGAGGTGTVPVPFVPATVTPAAVAA
jgi:hypothetical protein